MEIMPFLPFVFIFVIAIVFIKSREERQRADAQKEIQITLLNKFATSEELSNFLATEDGRRLIDTVSAKPEGADARKQAIGMTTASAVLICLAIAFFSLVIPGIMPKGFLITPAAIGAVGIGLAIGAALAWNAVKKAENGRNE